MITLRPDQLEVVSAIRDQYRRGFKAPLLVAPTGFGKTVVFAYIASQIERKGGSVTILVHRQELVDQIATTLQAFSVDFGIIAAGEPYRERLVQIASVQTLVRRLDAYAPPSFAIIDEAHHAVQGNTWGKVLAHWDCPRLGVTATPCRLSGEPLRQAFDTMVEGPSVAGLIQARNLSPFEIWAPPTVEVSSLHRRAGEFISSEVESRFDKPSIFGDVVEHYRKLAHGKQTIAFCSSVRLAHEFAGQFNAAGYRAAAVDGGMSADARRQAVNDYRSGCITVLTSCNLVEEGFDIPNIECGILLAPTLSLARNRQQLGRCLRTAPGKLKAIIIDHVGNTERHGWPDEPIEWSLDGKPKRRHAEDEVGDFGIRVCRKCFSVSRAGHALCAHCGVEFPVKARSISRQEGELIRAQRSQIYKKERREARTLAELQEMAKRKGYSSGWAYHVYNARQGRR